MGVLVKLVEQHIQKVLIVLDKSQLNSTYKVPYNTYATFYINVGGIDCYVATTTWSQPIEKTKPTINSMQATDINITNDDWITSKKINISGTENYCNLVNLVVKDEFGNIAYQGKKAVSSKKYNFEFIPKIEANEIEKTYNVIVTDANGNATTQNLVVKKVDSKEPSFETNNNENINYDTTKNIITDISDWSTSKNFDLYFKDDGIGKVSIGINNYDDIVLSNYDENVNAYKRNYTFVGDAYEPVNCVVYAKDGLGNLKTTTLVLNKIDNTKPTIENIKKQFDIVEVLSTSSEEENNNTKQNPTIASYAKITINANDINERLGLEGSGVTQYGIKSSNSSDIVWYDTNEIEINENGTYYIYVKDLVGNISSPLLLVIDELETEINNKVNVYVTQASDFSVKIPKVMILSGQTKQGEYKVIVEGNIGGMDSVNVKPDTILLLTQLGKDDILATVTQDKTTFNYDDFSNQNEIMCANGLVNAPNMTAGSWKGTFYFDIKFSVVTKDSSLGSVKEDANALEENVVGKDIIQDKHTKYKYGFELEDK